MKHVSVRWMGLAGLVLALVAGSLMGPRRTVAAETPAVKNKAGAAELIFLPTPRKLDRVQGVLRLEPDRVICLAGGSPQCGQRTARLIQEDLATVGAKWKVTASEGALPANTGMILRVDPTQVPRAEAYRLSITPSQIRLVAHDDAGLFYGAMTLRQLARQLPQAGQLPCMHIEDWPDFPNRGVMLDISRDKVPTMETLSELVGMFAELKFNQIQLYTEHTFAYRNHRDAWEKASPMTAEQVRQLDALCRANYIELVPNQNSFAHLDRWLQLPAYNKLAEVPTAASTICPTEPGSIKLLSELYGELLPNFTSRQINVGCDETSQVGEGKSKAQVAAKGAGQVYFDFIMQIHKEVRRRGHTMQFWGDVILGHPELIPQLPEGIIALDWGYEADSPFTDHGQKFAAAGVPFYVCPGTSSWGSLCGRTKNALGNLRSAAEQGLATGAIGYLITDWGDGGHYQYLPISYLGFSYGAAVSWAAQANRDLDIAHALDVHVFRDQAGVMGQVAYDLGNAYLKPGPVYGNGSMINNLFGDVNFDAKKAPFDAITTKGLETTAAYIRPIVARLDQARMTRPDAKLVVDEFRNNAAMMLAACNESGARLSRGGIEPGKLPADVRKRLAEERAQIAKEHRRLWLARNRIGGMEESAGGMAGQGGYYN